VLQSWRWKWARVFGWTSHLGFYTSENRARPLDPCDLRSTAVTSWAWIGLGGRRVSRPRPRLRPGRGGGWESGCGLHTIGLSGRERKKGEKRDLQYWAANQHMQCWPRV
jgi:hypothetical protein